MKEILLMPGEETILRRHGNINGKEGDVILTNKRLVLAPSSGINAAAGFGVVGLVIHKAKKDANIDLTDIKAISPMNKSGFEILLKDNQRIKGAFAKGTGFLTVNGQVAGSEDKDVRDRLIAYISQNV